MKKILFISLLSIFCFTNLFAQNSEIKNFNLKDYVAPDIKYRRLDLRTDLQAIGLKNGSTENSNSFGSNLQLRNFEYWNTKKVQSISTAEIYSSFQNYSYRADTTKRLTRSYSISANYETQTRFYNPSNNFIGLHGNVSYNFSPYTSKTNGDINRKVSSNSINISPYISVGTGRIEAVEPARRAIDILLSLQKANRLKVQVSNSDIDSLAKTANKIRYKRFYDYRYKIIYQLEELDKAMQNMDMVSQADIVYFANLNDIWTYAPNYERGSGLRYEAGIIPVYDYVNLSSEQPSIQDKSTHINSDYGIYGFFSYNNYKPVSYAWQSDIELDLTLGYASANKNWDDNGTITKFDEASLKGVLNTSYSVGYYPNTRTHGSISTYAATSFLNKPEENKSKFGVNAGLFFNSYYYISPRTRVSLLAGIYYIDNFTSEVPRPYWNVGNTTYNNNNDDTGITYRFSVSFAYSIL